MDSILLSWVHNYTIVRGIRWLRLIIESRLLSNTFFMDSTGWLDGWGLGEV